jgi:hypothetical protein
VERCSRHASFACWEQHDRIIWPGFGRKFHRDRFQDMCRTLRVLNAVRQFEIGIPLSIQQFKVHKTDPDHTFTDLVHRSQTWR